MISKFEKNRIAIATQVSQSHRNRKVRNRNRKYKNRKINVEIAIAKNQRCDAIGTPAKIPFFGTEGVKLFLSPIIVLPKAKGCC